MKKLAKYGGLVVLSLAALCGAAPQAQAKSCLEQRVECLELARALFEQCVRDVRLECADYDVQWLRWLCEKDGIFACALRYDLDVFMCWLEYYFCIRNGGAN
jgi:hypothetical protein